MVVETVLQTDLVELKLIVLIQGNLEGKLEVWSEGIYYFWSEVSAPFSERLHFPPFLKRVVLGAVVLFAFALH